MPGPCLRIALPTHNARKVQRAVPGQSACLGEVAGKVWWQDQAELFAAALGVRKWTRRSSQDLG